jgi:hypothetical protein
LRARDITSPNSANSRRLRQNLYLAEIESRINKIDESAVLELFNASLTNLTLSQIEALLESDYKLGKFIQLPGEYSSSDYYDEFTIDEVERDKFVIETFYTD